MDFIRTINVGQEFPTAVMGVGTIFLTSNIHVDLYTDKIACRGRFQMGASPPAALRQPVVNLRTVLGDRLDFGASGHSTASHIGQLNMYVSPGFTGRGVMSSDNDSRTHTIGWLYLNRSGLVTLNGQFFNWFAIWTLRTNNDFAYMYFEYNFLS